MSEETNRESRKNRLRRHIVKTPDVADMSPEQMDEALKQHRIKQVKFAGIVLLIIVLGILGFTFYMRFRTFSSFTVKKTTELSTASTDKYMAFGTGILKYGREGTCYISDSGEIVWNQGYQLTNPIAETSSSYAVIGDYGGTAIYIFDKSGACGSVKTLKAISAVTISDTGVIGVVTSDDSANYIDMFESDGKQIDVEIKTVLNQTGYPMDIAIAPGSSALTVVYMYLNQGTMQSQVAFYDFEVGKSQSDRLVGGFKYTDEVAAQVAYFSSTRVCVFKSTGLDFYNLTNAAAPTLTQSRNYSAEIKSIFYGQDQVGVITEVTDDSDAKYVVDVYGSDGSVKYSAKFKSGYTGARFCEAGLVIYGDSNCLIWDNKGRQKYEGSLEGMVINAVVLSGSSSLIQIGSGAMYNIRLK